MSEPKRIAEIRTLYGSMHHVYGDEAAEIVRDLLAHIDATRDNALLGERVRKLFAETSNNDYMLFESQNDADGFTVVANYGDPSSESISVGKDIDTAVEAACRDAGLEDVK